MFLYLAIELIDQKIDPGVHVVVLAVRVNIVARKMNCRLDYLTLLFHAKNDVNIDDLVKVTLDSGYFTFDIVADRIRHVDTMSVNNYLHGGLLISLKSNVLPSLSIVG